MVGVPGMRACMGGGGGRVSEHRQVEVVIFRQIMVDEAIADEIVNLNDQGVVTEGSCQGPPPVAMIRPSSVEKARALGYCPVYQGDVGLFEIELKSEIS